MLIRAILPRRGIIRRTIDWLRWCFGGKRIEECSRCCGVGKISMRHPGKFYEILNKVCPDCEGAGWRWV